MPQRSASRQQIDEIDRATKWALNDAATDHATAVVILLVLATGEPPHTPQSLANAAHCSLRTAKRHLAELRRAGLVTAQGFDLILPPVPAHAHPLGGSDCNAERRLQMMAWRAANHP